MAMVPDCFVLQTLKKHKGHGEAKLYIGCNDEYRDRLTSKPIHVNYSESYLNSIYTSVHSEFILGNINTFSNKYSSILIAHPRCTQDMRRMYIGAKDFSDPSWRLFRGTLLSYECCILFQEQETHIDCTIKPSLEFACNKTIGYSKASIDWLTYLEKLEDIEIQHAIKGGEFSIQTKKGYRWPVDGFCKETNTIYEFQGDYWHGNPKIYTAEDMCCGIPYSKKWEKDALKRQSFEEAGYKFVTIWESDWFDIKKLLN